ncbi:TPA: HD family hydrolase [Proteus mirabilis]|uniref:HD family hydrolase n=1 Tax=Proteus mirabilis TaxID=584 RepID=UPI000D99CAAB|nr:HD family hydrolase [Proteus mirabilis]KAB7716200.1 HD family hydrolase [Proteus mirabilis]MBG2812060.1 HD family hydrolase [Proteus mirabilis]MBG2900344.1 HD family hydrolase [Proteus mirabilis]MBI6502820.1 HD family hydrolase [Proteus mirabilis]MCL8601655.1 HD family hydrolase [Proteus mirabilis]
MSYIATATNKHFYYLDVRIEDIDIQDIATGLANECRFNGQIDNFYSVAQHSVYTSYLVAPEFALEALLHDASEAYVKDLPSPLKKLLPEYKLIELRVEKIIRKKFGLPENMSDEVHFADLMMLATEKRDLDIDADSNWLMLEGIPASDFAVNPLTPRQAKSLFLRRFNELYKEVENG